MSHAVSFQSSAGIFTQSLKAQLFAPVDNSFLAVFRLVFGLGMLWEVYRYFANGWIERYYIEPQIYFTYYGFDWVKPLAGDGMYGLFYLLGAAALCIAVGFRHRFFAAVFFAVFTYVFLIDQTRYLNHFYLFSLLSFLLIWLPAGRDFSIDAQIKPESRRQFAPAWTLYLLRFQIGIVYFFGGIAKLNEDWLRGEPLRSWLAVRKGFPLIGQFFTEEWMVYGFVMGGLLFDLLIVPFLLWKRTRLPAFAVMLVFHLLNSYLFNIGIFPWMMILLTTLFLPVENFRKVTGFFQRNKKSPVSLKEPFNPAAGEPDARPLFLSGEILTIALLALYAVTQIGLPLRHFLYPGNVSWTEEGHRFSWHMKLRDKNAAAVFLVSDPASGRKWEIQPKKYMKRRQQDKMTAHPDMILQFAHFLAAEKRREGYPQIEVRAFVKASLNGRRPQFLIDPVVNLAAAPRDLSHKWWVAPLETTLGESNAEDYSEGSGEFVE